MRKLIFGLLLAVFVFSTAMAIITYKRGQNEVRQFEQLQERMPAVQSQKEMTEQAVDQTENATELPAEVVALEKLHDENADVAAWIRIPSIGVDYPVMLTPDDPWYYLHRDFSGNETFRGTPFIGEGATLDSDIAIIYAHQMKDDTMFGRLDAFEEIGFMQENKVFSLVTLKDVRTYEVVAAFPARVLKPQEEGFRYYNFSGNYTIEEKQLFLGKIAEMNLYPMGMDVTPKDQLLMLSTCSSHTDEGRFVVLCKRR